MIFLEIIPVQPPVDLGGVQHLLTQFLRQGTGFHPPGPVARLPGGYVHPGFSSQAQPVLYGNNTYIGVAGHGQTDKCVSGLGSFQVRHAYISTG